ncbi:hypothetical protein [Amycolatopsis sp. Poz14]|uniref:hypothetical protein n=1 Tax=Amycolatopsis sp. Poz14 TaxID=1447705 RepID=UPI001EE88F74|nr:hypothetical protein [Amycolatopsis sp. Poz14]MCG3757367.1 hypothetical protein [Amycolatopsis sp. Poz14]
MVFTAGQKVRASELNALRGGIVAQTFYTNDGATGSATEVAADAQTFELNVNQRYEFEWQANVVASAPNPYFNVRFRIASGSSADTSSPIIRTYLVPVWGSGKFHYMQVNCPVKGSDLAAMGLSSGTATVRVCAFITPGNGGGTWTVKGAGDAARQILVRVAGENG